MKKILTIILTSVMVLNIAIVPAFAEYKDTEPIKFTGEAAQACLENAKQKQFSEQQKA